LSLLRLILAIFFSMFVAASSGQAAVVDPGGRLCGSRARARSGYGRELIGLGVKEFVNYKPIDVVGVDAHF
jgi:uncharacterized membrane protein